ncbi:MAG TPA: DUF885 domain-containing protein [Candidatus Limnocylindrales bacterium]
MSEFARRIESFLDEFFLLDPLAATAAGEHSHDDRWPDLSEAGEAAQLAFVERWTAELEAMGDAALRPDDRVDRDLLLLELSARRFAIVDLREGSWDALSWVYLLGGGIVPLLSRDFAPLGVRLASVSGRLESVPAVLAEARRRLVGHGDRPVSRLHVETALRQLPGVVELVDDAVREAEAHEGEPDVMAVVGRLGKAADLARSALHDFGRHLRDVVLPAAEGEGRLGRELFWARLHHTIGAEHPNPDEILAQAEREYDAVRGELVRLARDQWPAWGTGEPMPVEDGALVRGVLDAIAADHPLPEQVLDFCSAELERIEAFCRERGLIGLADEPLEIRWTPVFQRSAGGAMLDSPGPLDRDQKAFFSITPIPDDWTPKQAESYLREDNARMLRLLTIHEAVPGHYLQGVYANRCPSLPRAVFWSGVFVEGWAVYVTQVMIDAGFAADDAALLLTHWKFYLRSVTNAIIDIRIHTTGMTEDEAVSFMVEGGFQEEAEARAKYNRARLSSTQLSTYFVGSTQLWELERERRVGLAVAAGDPRAEAIAAPGGLPGGFGETAGFRYRDHLESVIGQGAPPIPLLRRLILA